MELLQLSSHLLQVHIWVIPVDLSSSLLVILGFVSSSEATFFLVDGSGLWVVQTYFGT